MPDHLPKRVHSEPLKPARGDRPGRAGASALALGTQLTAGMVFFAGLGYLADRRFGGGVLFTACGMFMGLGYGAYEVWKLVRELNAEDGTGTKEV